MNKITLAFALAAFAVFSTHTSLAQTTATQTVTLAVSSVQKLSVSGNPAPLTIGSGVAGTEGLTSVTDATTTYSETHNNDLHPKKYTGS